MFRTRWDRGDRRVGRPPPSAQTRAPGPIAAQLGYRSVLPARSGDRKSGRLRGSPAPLLVVTGAPGRELPPGEVLVFSTQSFLSKLGGSGRPLPPGVASPSSFLLDPETAGKDCPPPGKTLCVCPIMTAPDRLATISETLLMGPGPSLVPSEVYQALAHPTIGHLDPRFVALMDEIKEMLRTLMGTRNEVTLPLSGTGSAGMEAAFVNLVEPGDPVLVLVNGVFGTRMVDVAARLGAEVHRLDFEWGTPVVPEVVAGKLAERSYRLVAVVHAETSTGVRNPVDTIGALVEPTGALYLVDAVTSLGGMPVEVDSWRADAVYSGSQKCLSCPPGLAPFTISERAMERIRSRTRPVPNWYLDVGLLVGYWAGGTRAYHHTAPINMLYGLYQALRLIVMEGLEAVWERHRLAHRLLVEGLEALGLEMLVAPGWRLPMLNAVKVPSGVDEARVRRRLLDEERIEIGGGLGPLAGKIWRIGLMGHTARPENVERVLGALKRSL